MAINKQFIADTDTQTHDGGSGFDTVIFSSSRTGVTIDLSHKDDAGYSTGSGGDADGDRFRNVEKLVGSNHADTFTGDEAHNAFRGGGGGDTLDGGSGDTSDVASYVSSRVGVRIDLSRKDDEGYSLGSGGDAEGDRLRNIEHLTGSNTGDDVLIGDDGANRLIGRGGDDVLDGRGGVDTVSWRYSKAGVQIDLGTTDDEGYSTGSGGNAEGDKLKNIENLIGSSHGDTLTGDEGANRLTGGAGRDVLDGGGGVDTASWRYSTTGVTVDLSRKDAGGYSTGSGGNAEGDKLKNIENLVGSSHNDILIGDGSTNKLVGRGGNDTLIGGGGDDLLIGGAGADIINGGAGTDTASWAGSSVEVSVLLQSPPLPAPSPNPRPDPANGDFNFDDIFDTSSSIFGAPGPLPAPLIIPNGLSGDAQGDILLGIENLTGSDHDDRLGGDGGANVLDGGGGNDTLVGHGGSDTLIGGAGEDTLGGGEGRDTLTGGAGNDKFLVGVINASLDTADHITDFTRSGNDSDTLFVGIGTSQIWYERKDADGDGDMDTVIYADAARRGVHAILDDYTGALETEHFADYLGNPTTMTISEIT